VTLPLALRVQVVVLRRVRGVGWEGHLRSVRRGRPSTLCGVLTVSTGCRGRTEAPGPANAS
jgi:hypothetical protein